METTLHFAQNADAGTEESYLRNLPLLKLLAKENIEADDWSVLLAATPNNEDSQTKAVADAAKDSAETSKAAAETSKDLLNKTTAAAQQAAASVASASYALGPDESGRLSFFIKKST